MILRMFRVGRLELQASCSQTVEINFFWLFLMVLTLFATFRSLFGALNSTVSEYSGAVCGQTCGQRALLDQVQHPLPSPVQKGSFLYSGLGYCTSVGTEKQGIFSSQAYQFLIHLYKEYSLAGGGPNSPAQEPTKACSCALYRMIVVITRIQLKHRIDPLTLAESINLFCVLSDASQNRVSSFALLLYSKEAAGTTGVKRTYSSAVNKLRIVRTHDFLAYLC